MSWTKQEFDEFCKRCGVDPNKALKEGHVNLSPKDVTVQTLGNMAQKVRNRRRRQRAIENFFTVQDTKRESDQAVALDKKAQGQDKGMERVNPRFKISIIGHRVRPIDPDNFAAGCKGIIDGVVRARLIPDDDWNTVEVVFAQRKVSAWSKEGTELIIEYLGPEAAKLSSEA